MEFVGPGKFPGGEFFMRTARKFLLLTTLMAILIAMLFFIPDGFEAVKVALGLLCLAVLFLFMGTFIKWRKNMKPEEKEELETTEI